MTIQALINKIFRANQTQNNTVSWSGSNGLKSIQEDIVDTIRQRTFFTVPSTVDLTNQGFGNAVLCYVQDNAFYRWEPSGIPNGTTIFPANDGGVWVQETIGDTDGTVTNVSALTINSTGTDLSSTVANPTTTPVITLSVPTASAVNRGVLSPTDWSTFNGKQNAITLTTTGTSGAATLVGSTLNIPQYQSVITNPVTGTGTTNYLSKWTSSSSLNNSLVYDNGTNVLIGTTTDAGYKFDVNGTARVVTSLRVGANGNTYTSIDNGSFNISRISDGGNGIVAVQAPTILSANRQIGRFNGRDGVQLSYDTASRLQVFQTTITIGLGANDTSLTNDTSTILRLDGSKTASSAIARGANFVPTLVAAANNDVLVGLDVNPTFTNGAFTGLTNLGLRVTNGFRLFTGGAVPNQHYLEAISTSTSNAYVNLVRNASAAGTYAYYLNNGVAYLSVDNGTGETRLWANSGGYYLTFFSNGVEAMRIPTTRNVLIGTTTDAGFKLDVNGTARIQNTLNMGTSTDFQISGTSVVNKGISRLVGNGNGLIFSENMQAAQIAFQFVGNGSTTGNSKAFLNTGGKSVFNINVGLGNPNTSNCDASVLLLDGIHNITSFSNTIIRGIYYNPTLTSLTGVISHRAIETATGDVILGSTSGNVAIGTTTLGTATRFTLGGSQTASSAIARGGLVNTTLVAAANNDVLVGLDVNPTFTNGAFTNVSNLAIRTNGNVQVRGNTTQFGQVLQVLNTAGSSNIFYVRDVGDAFISQTLWLSAQNGSNFISGGQLGITSNTGTVGNQFIRFTHNNGNNAFRILSNSNIELNPVAGNVLIGTTTDAGYKLDVNGTARVQGTLAFNNGNTYVSNNSNNIWIAAVNSVSNDIALIPGRQVNVSNTGTYTAQTSALVQIDSTTKGFLKPRMTTTQRNAIATPATGLEVYNTTTNTEDYYNGTTWVSLQTTTAATKSFGAWQEDTTQTAASSNTGYGVKFSTPDISGYGVNVINDPLGDATYIEMVNNGVYNIQFSLQLQNTDGQIKDVTIWLRKNGNTTADDIPATAGFVSVPNSHGGTPGTIIAAWNYFVEAAAGDFFQLVWSTSDHTRVTIEFYPAGSPPPSAASAILTVNQVN
jgi:hypothetical protein